VTHQGAKSGKAPEAKPETTVRDFTSPACPARFTSAGWRLNWGGQNGEQRLMEQGEWAVQRVEELIYVVRGLKVMLSSDLAELYDVQPKALIQAVKRNIDRFPPDFMFPLSRQEFTNLKSRIVTSSWGGARRALPYAFTEQGVAMLSSVLRSDRAIQVNIAIMRAFVRLRGVLSGHKELTDKLDELERKLSAHDENIRTLFQAIRQLMAPPAPPRKPIGFKVRERSARYGRN